MRNKLFYLLLITILVVSITSITTFAQTLYIPSGTPSGIGTSGTPGNVGIGTSTPLDKLHVNGHIAIEPDDSTVPSYLNFKRFSDGWIAARIGQRYSLSGYGSHLIFETNTGSGPSNIEERMRITYDGKVGIGTSTPTHKLEMVGGTFQVINPGLTTSYQLIFRDEASANSSYFYQRKTNNYHILGSNANGTGTVRKLGFAIAGGDNESDVKMTLDQNGNLGIGTQTPNQKLTVNGTIYGKEIKVDLNVPAPDYVFEKNYELRSLAEVETYIQQNSHLPEVPAASEMEKNGVNLGEMNMLLLKKVEELTLYVIEQSKEIESLKAIVKK